MLQPTFDIGRSNETIVSFTLDRARMQKNLVETTSKNVGKRLAIILDNKIISAPVVIREPILTGKWPDIWKFYISISN